MALLFAILETLWNNLFHGESEFQRELRAFREEEKRYRELRKIHITVDKIPEQDANVTAVQVAAQNI